MTGKLEQEIKQTRPFQLLGEETALKIVRTAQYNVLHILRGAGAAGAFRLLSFVAAQLSDWRFIHSCRRHTMGSRPAARLAG